MPVIDSPGFRMADRLAGGKLVKALTTLRAEGLSHDRITRVLFADYGIEVSRPTVARWCRDLGLDEPNAAAS